MWHDLQDRFAAALTAPGAPVPDGIDGGDGRFDVYRNNVALGLKGALADAYPVVRALVGDDFFDAMAGAYIETKRPSSPMMMDYGRDFAAFIGILEPAERVPYLADVARLERRWLDAYHAADAEPLPISVLAEVPESRLDALRFETHPAVALLRSDWPVASIWRAHQAPQPVTLLGIEIRPEYVLIARPGLDVGVETLAADAYAFMAALSAGVPLGDACGFASDEEFDPAPHLAAFFRSGCVVGLIHEDD